MSAAATAEGLELARSLDESLARIVEIEALLEATGADSPVSAEVAEVIAGLGVHGVAVPERAGGLGLSLGDRVRLAAVFGRRLVPAAIRDEAFGLAPALAALSDAAEAGPGAERAAELLGRAAEGELRGAVALVPRGTAASVHAYLPEGAEVVALLGADRLALHALGEGATAEPLHALDAGQGMCTIEAGGEPIASVGGEPARALRREYELMLCCEAFGTAERWLEVAAEYAEQREQFGRPIASFQALAHLLSGMKLEVEVSRAGIGRCVDLFGEAEAAEAALEDSVATLAHAVPAAARRAIEGAIQVHGGIGFSWELGLHLSYRRVLAVQYLLGGHGPTAERIGAEYMSRRSER